MEMSTKRSNGRAVIYGRSSLQKNNDERQSCRTQIEVCRRYCDLNRLEVVGISQDNKMTRANAANRPGLQMAIHQAVKKQAALVVHSLSSLSWNTKEIVTITKRLQHAKANLYSIADGIDTATDFGLHFFKTAELFINLESKLTSERTSSTMIQQQRAGRRMSSKPPYGMMINPKDSTKLITNVDEQRAIKRMIELHKIGTSFRGIARQLTEEGYEARRKPREFKGRIVQVRGQWRGDHVARIIRRQEKL